jgi:hypothetical protein
LPEIITRQDAIALIQSEAPEFLIQELEYQLDIEFENDEGHTWDMLSVLFDVERAAEDNRDRRMIDACRTILIRIGFYREMPATEIANTFRTGGGPVWAFKRNKVAYTTDFTADAWQFERKGWNVPL